MPAAELGALAIGGISKIAGFLGADSRARQARRSALDAFALKVSDLGARRQEEAAAARLEIQQARQSALAQSSQASVAAAEGGVSGLSVSALQRALEGDEAAAAGIVKQNLGLVNDQLDRERRGVGAELKNRLNSIQGPSALEAALGIGGIAFQAATNGPLAPKVANPAPGGDFTVGPIERMAPQPLAIPDINRNLIYASS